MANTLLLDVPLYLLHEEPLLLYIFDSEIFSCLNLHHRCYYFDHRTLNILYELFSLPASLEELPAVFHDFFSSKSSLFPLEAEFDFIVGGSGFWGHPSLNFQLSAKPESIPSQVLFHSFQYEDRLLLKEISLPIKDTFFILANHWINKKRQLLLFDPPTQTVDYSKFLPKNESKKDPILSQFSPFTIQYANYLIGKITTQKLSLPYLLSRNGAGVITLLRKHPFVQNFIKELLLLSLDISDLTLIQKAQLYSVIKLNEFDNWYIDSPSSEIELFFHRKDKIIRKLSSETTATIQIKPSFLDEQIDIKTINREIRRFSCR
ncbi:MAG: hypothetical protein ACTSQX_13240 [Candidatus Heimdallarchaeota archaeon]